MTANKIIPWMRSKGKHLTGRLRNYLERRSQRQRFWIILAMLAAFAALDVCVIARSYYRIHTEHIQFFNP